MTLEQRRAVFMRGGTSKAIIFRAADLPQDRAQWDPIFLAAIGSPDPNLRQLDGMGGGVSSLSKVCVVGPPSRGDADVDYTFAQVAIDEPMVDYGGNCGNMSSAIGPFAVDEGLVKHPADGEAVVRIHNTNTGKIIVARFPVAGGRAVVAGDLALDGVAGTGAPIRLDFTEPGGSKTGKLLPSGHAAEMLGVRGLGRVRVSLLDAGNPCVFLAASELGLKGTELPSALERDTALMQKLEAIRCHGSAAMGIAADPDAAARLKSVPKLALLSTPVDAPTLSGRVAKADEIDILARAVSVGQPHRAVPLTLALALAVACRIPGSVAEALVRRGPADAPIRIGHPSGSILVAAEVNATAGGISVPYATVYRTARRLFQGEVLYQRP
jgi:2-methylaconitate cis-trans-isomerase PrpF